MDAAEFKYLFLPCQNKLYRLAFRLTGNAQDAEDMVQETYLRLWKRRGELVGLTNPDAFCMTTLKNVCFDAMRQKRPPEDDSPPEQLSIADTQDISLETEMVDSAEILTILIDKLPEPQRSVIRMRDISDLSFDEIGLATGISEGNIRVLLSRARKKIREQFNNILKYERK